MTQAPPRTDFKTLSFDIAASTLDAFVQGVRRFRLRFTARAAFLISGFLTGRYNPIWLHLTVRKSARDLLWTRISNGLLDVREIGRSFNSLPR